MSSFSSRDLSIADIAIYDPTYPEFPSNARELIIALRKYTQNSTIHRLFFATMHVLIELENEGETKNKDLVMEILDFLNVDWNLFWIYKLSLDALGLDNVIEITYKILDLPFLENYVNKLKDKSFMLYEYCIMLIERFKHITTRTSKFYY